MYLKTIEKEVAYQYEKYDPQYDPYNNELLDDQYEQGYDDDI